MARPRIRAISLADPFVSRRPAKSGQIAKRRERGEEAEGGRGGRGQHVMDTLAKTLINSAEIKKARGAGERKTGREGKVSSPPHALSNESANEPF